MKIEQTVDMPRCFDKRGENCKAFVYGKCKALSSTYSEETPCPFFKDKTGNVIDEFYYPRRRR